MGRISADVAVADVDLLAAKVLDEPGLETGEAVLGHRPVHVAPPDLVARRRLVHDDLVLRGAACVVARTRDEWALGRDHALAVADRLLVEHRPGRAGDRLAADREPVRPGAE